MRFPRASIAGALIAVLLLAVGCSSVGASPRQGVVFSMATGFYQKMPVTTIDVLDLGVPQLSNISGYAIKLNRVSLASTPQAVHVRSVTAYRYGSSGQIALAHGDLLRHCRKEDPPHPVGDVIVPPRSDANWYIVIAMTFTKPGRYYFGQARIYYTANGHLGWQYQNLFTTITVRRAPLGAKPALDGC